MFPGIRLLTLIGGFNLYIKGNFDNSVDETTLKSVSDPLIPYVGRFVLHDVSKRSGKHFNFGVVGIMCMSVTLR